MADGELLQEAIDMSMRDTAADNLSRVHQVHAQAEARSAAVGRLLYERMQEYTRSLEDGRTALRPGPVQRSKSVVELCKAIRQLVDTVSEGVV